MKIKIECPNCHENTLNEMSQPAKFCFNCGTNLQTEILPEDNSPSSQLLNATKLCETAMAANNVEEALLYANRILELDADNTNGWFYKMKSTYDSATLGDLKCREIIACGLRAIETFPTQEFCMQIYLFFLTACLHHLKFCTQQLQDTASIKAYYDSVIRLKTSKASKKTLRSDDVANLVLKERDDILSLRFNVPNSIIIEDPDLTNLNCEIAKQWVYFQNSMNERFNVYKTSMNDTSLNEYRRLLYQIKEGLPYDKMNIIGIENMSNERKNGCYIATAIYDSYNAPEVVILRNFRDGYLRRTTIGRYFIKIYYAISPTFSVMLKGASVTNKIVRKLLDSFILCLRNKY